MNQGYARPAVWSDIAPIAATMRPNDISEVQAASGSTPEGALTEGLLTTLFGGKALTICLPDGTPVGMMGVTHSGQADVGVIWMLASEGLATIQRQFIRESRKYIDEITRGYRVVFNYSDARNELHHRWLQWTGFTIINRHEEWGRERRPFLEFCKITETSYV